MTPRTPAGMTADTQPGALRRDLGVFAAAMMGLGSIVGTGVFVSIGIAAGIAGPSVLPALVLAGAVAACNALSSAQLAANCPTSGGTYEYGYVYLRPWLGFAAGWMFLCAKSASAATAALGFSAYSLDLSGVAAPAWGRIALGCAAVVALTMLVLGGVRRSGAANVLIVTATLVSLALFVLLGVPSAVANGTERFLPLFESPIGDGRSAMVRFLEAAALMFVAYTGYGRIATMGEEVRNPRTSIPRAIVLALGAAMALYIAVAAVGIGAAGAGALSAPEGSGEAPLAAVARQFGPEWLPVALAVGAMTAMLGVLLNLVLGLSRVALAMARRGDLPRALAHVDSRRASPSRAVLLVGFIVLAIAAMGSIRLAWSFSAFTVLVYYAVTNLAAIRLPPPQRLYHPAIAWAGLLGCLSLAFFIEWRICAAGLGVLGAGLVARALLRSALRPA
ncbi:MAG: amino acid permease [Phycisphaeraceae bacterium]|nr:amino acid permease [Phycisphaeraceae bacterium]